MKIKKEEKMQIEKLPTLKLKYLCYLRDRWSPVCSLGAFMEDYDRWKDDPGESCDRKEKSGPIYGSEKSGRV